MSWKDDLLAASFRGVPFFFGDLTRSGGRRLAEHEFPLRDDPYIEDLGRKKREHKIAGYVLGDDYVAQRDALEAALDEPGAGLLLHPYRGQISVNVRNWSSHEVRDEGGMARFDIDCVENGSQPSPLATSNTADESLSAGADMLGQLQGSFLDDWSVDSGGMLDAASALLDDLADALASLITWPKLDTSAIAALISGLGAVASDGVAVATALSDFFDGYATAAVAAQISVDEAYSSRGAEPLLDPSYGLTATAGWGATLPPPLEGQIETNQNALAVLVGGCATVALSQIYARINFSAQEDADAARDRLSAGIDTLATAAADAGDDESFAAWQMLYQAATDDLTTRAKQAPSTIVFTLAGALPALALTQRFYQDPSRAGELVARNSAPHPLFLPATVQALTA